MHSTFFLLAIAALTILALVGCTNNIKVIKSLQVLTLDLSSISISSVFPEISSELSSIPDYIKIGLMGYCTPDTCVKKDFAKFNIETVLIEAVLANNNLTDIATSAVSVVLPTKYTDYVNDINKIVDVFSILLAVWFCLAIIGFAFVVVKICLDLRLFFFISSFCKGVCFSLGIACTILATVGLLFAKREFNSNSSDDLGMTLAVGKAFLGLLWAAVFCSVLDAIISLVIRITFRRRRRETIEEPITYNLSLIHI